MINAHEAMKLTIEVLPTPQEYELWRTQLLFLENAKAGAILTENEQKIAEGIMEYLKNSKFEVPEINLNKSLIIKLSRSGGNNSLSSVLGAIPPILFLNIELTI